MSPDALKSLLEAYAPLALGFDPGCPARAFQRNGEWYVTVDEWADGEATTYRVVGAELVKTHDDLCVCGERYGEGATLEEDDHGETYWAGCELCALVMQREAEGARVDRELEMMEAMS